MIILVTGVAGFIGSHIARRLLMEGHHVIGVDNFSHGYERNITAMRNNPNFDFYAEDVTDFYTTKQLDIIIHLASQKIPRYTSSFITLASNNEMLKNVIYLARINRAKLVFSSTSDVYGKNQNIPFSEESELVLGRTDIKRWAYSVSKIYSEHYIIACHEEFGLDYTIMRFFSSYGENQNTTWWGGPQGAFIQNALEGKEIEIHGTGMQSRCFTYIDDLIEGIMLCIFNPKANNEIFNIGNPFNSITISGLANTICDIMGKPVLMKNIPYSTFGKYEDVMVRMPNIDKIRALGFKPKYSLIDGLKKTIKWQTELYENDI